MLQVYEWGAAIIIMVGLVFIFFCAHVEEDPETFGAEAGFFLGLFAFVWPVAIIIGPILLWVWLGDDKPKQPKVKQAKPPKPVKPKYPDLPDLRAAYPPGEQVYYR